ncbi:MAG: F420-dependent NADP oxidoreductase [Acinetobacter sp.]
MRISFIGSGRVAHHLAKQLSKQHQIVQIYSRRFEHAQHLAEQCDAQAIQNYAQFDNHIDLLIIAVSDQAIADVIGNVASYLENVLVVHTSGSTHLNVLSQQHDRSGVFYPLQTFSLEREIDWLNTPLFVEATKTEDLDILTTLANSLSNRVYSYNSAQRLSLHLAAVFACNFSNYCYDMAKQVVDAEQVDFSLLYPLILETAKKVTHNDPKIMQTGPAIRGDHNILNMHMNMLKDARREDLKELYQSLSLGIQKSQRSE